jgi:hypothetical protein
VWECLGGGALGGTAVRETPVWADGQVECSDFEALGRREVQSTLENVTVQDICNNRQGWIELRLLMEDSFGICKETQNP